MKRLKLVALAIFTLSLWGCGGGSGSSGEHAYHYPPELDGFHLVDSYGDSSEDNPSLLLALNPYVDDGLFEVYWFVDNVEDYTVELRINDRPSFSGSRLISNDYCGYQLDCDHEGLMWCEYYDDFSLSCDPPHVNEPGKYVTYFDDWVLTIPQSMYFILEVCDTFSDSCEFQVREVLME